MKKTALAVATAMAAATIGFATPAVAAPSGAGSAQDTVNQLDASGYRVIVNKFGDAPLDQCSVAAVRPGRQITEVRSLGDDFVIDVVYTTVYVDAKC